LADWKDCQKALAHNEIMEVTMTLQEVYDLRSLVIGQGRAILAADVNDRQALARMPLEMPNKSAQSFGTTSGSPAERIWLTLCALAINLRDYRADPHTGEGAIIRRACDRIELA
jgi:hypothetical protein